MAKTLEDKTKIFFPMDLRICDFMNLYNALYFEFEKEKDELGDGEDRKKQYKITLSYDQPYYVKMKRPANEEKMALLHIHKKGGETLLSIDTKNDDFPIIGIKLSCRKKYPDIPEYKKEALEAVRKIVGETLS